MKTNQKKVMRAFRLASDLNAELKEHAAAVDISETQLVEDAIKSYISHFARNCTAQLKRKLASIRGAQKRAAPRHPSTMHGPFPKLVFSG